MRPSGMTATRPNLRRVLQKAVLEIALGMFVLYCHLQVVQSGVHAQAL